MTGFRFSALSLPARLALGLLGLALLVPETAHAQPKPGAGQPTLLGQYGDWGAYLGNSGGRKVCFALAKPVSSETNPPNRPRDPAYMFVSSRPAEQVTKRDFHHHRLSVQAGLGRGGGDRQRQVHDVHPRRRRLDQECGRGSAHDRRGSQGLRSGGARRNPAVAPRRPTDFRSRVSRRRSTARRRSAGSLSFRR